MSGKKIVYVAAGIILLGVVGYLVWGQKTKNGGNEKSQTATGTSQITTSTRTSPKTAAPKTTAPKTTAPVAATQKYLDALKIYKTSGYYFQFVDCHGSPGSLVLKKGKKFMLDNRDNQTRKIAIVGGQSFNITAYNFAIATAPSSLGVHYITCDGGGAAAISVQP